MSIASCRKSTKFPLRQAGRAGTVDGAAVGEVEFFGGESHLGDGEVLPFRIGVPGVLKRIQVNAITVLTEIIVFNMDRIGRGDGNLHGQGIAVDVGPIDMETLHIVTHEGSIGKANIALGVRQGVDMDRKHAAVVSPGFDLEADILPLPFVPVRDMREGFSAERPVREHLPLRPALIAAKQRALR